jgi:autotransporter-associated beta strand protein/T5SS/PEP-CTERM-associated repeat protein
MPLVLASGGAAEIQVDNTSTTLTLSGAISGGGILNKTGNGVLVLSGNNSFTQALKISAGTLGLGSDTALSSAGLIGNGGALQSVGAARSVANDVDLAADLTVSGSLDLTLNGTIHDSGGIIKSGSGTLTLAGSLANTYTGITTVLGGGPLVLNKSIANGTIVGAELAIYGSVVEAQNDQIADATQVPIFSGGSLTLNSGISDSLGGVGLAGGTITTSGTGYVSIASIGTNGNGTTSTINGQINQNAMSSWNVVPGAGNGIDLDVPAVIFGSGGITKLGLGGVRLSGSNTFTGGVTLSQGTILIGNDSALGTGMLTANGGALQSDGATHSISNAVNLTGSLIVSGIQNLTLAGVVSGLGGITKNGSGALTLSGSNTFTGGMAINAGTVNIPSLSVNASTDLWYINPSGTLNIAGDLALSSGAVQLFGSGSPAMTVGGTVTHTGGTLEVDAGSLNMVNYSRGGSSVLQFNGGTTTVTGKFDNGGYNVVLDGASNPALVLSGPAASTTGVFEVRVGITQSGTLTIQNGAVFTDSGFGSLGENSSSSGSVTVTGTASAWSTLSADIGGAGYGQLTVSSGGTVTAGGAGAGGVAGSGGGAISVTGAGSSLTCTDAASGLYIGGGAINGAGQNGTLNIQSGGSVSVAGLTKVFNSSGTSLTIDGGTLTTHDFMRLGTLNFNDGTLTVSGGVFTDGTAPSILGIGGATQFDQATLQLLGGATTSNIAELVVGFIGPGTLVVDSSTLSSSLVIRPNGTLKFNNGLIAGDPVINQGLVMPISSQGTLRVNGNYSAQTSAATLEVELGGTMAGTNYNQLIVSGNMSLDGTLQVSLANSYSPSLGDRFDILDWGTRSGTFATLQLPALGGTLAWNTVALYSNGTLSVIDTNFLPGDFDRDGHVSVADIAAAETALADLSGYRAAHGNMTSAQLVSIGDLDGDGLVTNADLQGLINLLANGGGSGSLAAVPEPSSLVLAAIAGLAIWPIIWRRWWDEGSQEDRVAIGRSSAMLSANPRPS